MNCKYNFTTYELTEDLGDLLREVQKHLNPFKQRIKHLEYELFYLSSVLRHMLRGKKPGRTLKRHPPRFTDPRLWSDEEIGLVADHFKELGCSAIAERLGRTKEAVYQKRRWLKQRGFANAIKEGEEQEDYIGEYPAGSQSGPTAETGGGDIAGESEGVGCPNTKKEREQA